jgi:hypothetical protein
MKQGLEMTEKAEKLRLLRKENFFKGHTKPNASFALVRVLNDFITSFAKCEDRKGVSLPLN